MSTTPNNVRPTSFADFRFYEAACLFRVFERDGFAGGRWREVSFMNFPVEENALGMSTRQIGWEKRKRVKEATMATAATATSSFSLLLDSFQHLPSYFFAFSRHPCYLVPFTLLLSCSPPTYIWVFLQKLTSASMFIEKFETVRRELVLHLASCFPII